jgi:cytochrome c biogenesis protein CcdA
MADPAKQLPRFIVGAAVMLLATGIVAGLFLIAIPQSNQEVALVVLGVAIGWAGNVVNYFYGTSDGSVRKTDIMSERKY